MGALKAQKRGAPPVFSSSRHKPTSNMAATSSNSLGQVNTLIENIKRYKTGEFKINPCDVLIEPLVRPLKEDLFGVTRLVESFKSKENRLKAYTYFYVFSNVLPPVELNTAPIGIKLCR